MKLYGLVVVVFLLSCFEDVKAHCKPGQTLTFNRWSGVTPLHVPPVFVYSASGDESSLAGACLSRCKELEDCAAVAVAYGRGSCQGVAASKEVQVKADSDVGYFQKICLDLPTECRNRWWTVETTPGYHLNTDGPSLKVMLNATIQECNAAVLSSSDGQFYRSAQWIGPEDSFDIETIKVSQDVTGNCVLNVEDRITEPESYRVANYQTFYIENQCRHDYSKKIDRCSYEEYFNQTLKHVEYSITNYTKDECRTACEVEDNFVCRGFSWSHNQGRASEAQGRRSESDTRGVCDLHSEDLVSTGSWLLRKSSYATYYRRVVCLNISVECEESSLTVTYRPRGSFRGRVYVPGRDERCSARADGALVKLQLPLHGDCDVNFAHAISHGPSGLINRTMAYVMLMIQNNPIIQTAGDRWVRVGCSPGGRATLVDAAVAVRDTKPSLAQDGVPPSAASAVLSNAGAAVSMYVLRADDPAPRAGAAVSLGEPLELRLDTYDEREIEPYHLVASSRLGDSSVLLLDGRGCPTGQVDFPEFSRSWVAGAQRLSARFKAFRFPTSPVVRFALMIRYCDGKCPPANCDPKQGRSARNTNYTEEIPALVTAGWRGVVSQGGGGCECEGHTGGARRPLELELNVGGGDLLSADTLVRADSHTTYDEDLKYHDAAMVCIHELLLVALTIAWLAVQVLLLIGCCVLVKRYRNLAEMSMQKDYQSFDNVGFDAVSTPRRVHWPDQDVDMLHVT